MSVQRGSNKENWQYPFGFLLFSRSAALLLGAVATATNLLVAPCGNKKKLGTRAHCICEMGSSL